MSRVKVFSFSHALNLRREGDRAGLEKYLAVFVRRYRFQKDSDTEWAYRKVLSHLEDGWTDLSSCCELNEFSSNAGMSKDNIGQIVNIIIGGTEESALVEGDWPTKYDVSAFVYFSAFKLPKKIDVCSSEVDCRCNA